MARRAPIQARPASPPRVGLIASAYDAGNLVDLFGQRWPGGYKYAPENCIAGGRFNPCSILEGDLDIDDNAAVIEFEPFGVFAGDRCSSFGFNARDYRGRAERLMNASESKLAEMELWRGDQARIGNGTAEDPDPWPNRYLASPDAEVVTDGPENLVSGLACLEEYLAECGSGTQGVIHASRALVTHWSFSNLLHVDGRTYRTFNDTIVISGAGYDGSGPGSEGVDDGAPVDPTDSLWAYATGLVGILRSGIMVTPEPIEGETFQDFLRHSTDRSLNTVEVRISREIGFVWDECCLGAAEFNVAPCSQVGS